MYDYCQSRKSSKVLLPSLDQSPGTFRPESRQFSKNEERNSVIAQVYITHTENYKHKTVNDVSL